MIFFYFFNNWLFQIELILSMIKYILLFGWFFVFKVSAQNAASVRLEDVVCRLESYKSFRSISDSIEKRMNSLNDSIMNLDQYRCVYLKSVLIESDRSFSEYTRWSNELEELDKKFSWILDSMNNEIRMELRTFSEGYCKLNNIDLFFTSNDPPIFGIMPKDVSEEFAAFILSLE